MCPADSFRGVVVIPDSFPGYSPDEFCLLPRYRPFIEGILVPNGLVKDRLKKLALDILDTLDRMGSTSLTLVCVLKGGFKFASDLSENLESVIHNTSRQISIHIEFIIASTYVNDDVAHDTDIKVCTNPSKFHDKDLLILEDLTDTGTTLRSLTTYLQKLSPRSIQVASLLVKRRPDCLPFKPDYVGFEVPNRFIVGYAIDYNDQFRELPHVCVVNEVGKKEFAVEK
ncbi:unnamed protein product [Dicrocoelium dendriticum]|nr:unnamed protein product [Dicrocoelium dendriticum]